MMNVTEIPRNWAIDTVVSVQTIPSYWSKASWVTTADSSVYVLKEKDDRTRINNEYVLLSWLAQHDVPVAAPMLAISGQPCALHDGKTFCLYPRLPGDVIHDHYSDGAKERAKGFGQAIGQLHVALAEWEITPGFEEMNLLNSVTNYVLPTVHEKSNCPDSLDIEAVSTAVTDFETKITPLYKRLTKHLIHRDPNPMNMLFDGGELSGILDFDMVVRSVRIFDPCYCASSILVSGFGQPEQRTAWSNIFCALLDGYEQYIPLTVTEREAIHPILMSIQLLFIAFSLNMGNPGAAKFNERVLYWLCDM
ncbi:MAG: phosphotransferase [Chloroflexi bacterium]|nr:phosphotransferase [Chloroflexota bacterium]